MANGNDSDRRFGGYIFTVNIFVEVATLSTAMKGLWNQVGLETNFYFRRERTLFDTLKSTRLTGLIGF